jgi:hypothetical protein
MAKAVDVWAASGSDGGLADDQPRRNSIDTWLTVAGNCLEQ